MIGPMKRAESSVIRGGRLPAGGGGGGGGGWLVPRTTSVGAETAVASPLAFVAVTETRSLWPTSAARTPYVRPVAPFTSTQPVPPVLQRFHWNANERAPPVHVPGSAVSSSPTCG